MFGYIDTEISFQIPEFRFLYAIVMMPAGSKERI